MAIKRIKLKNATGDYLEPYTTNVPDASNSVKGLVQIENTPTENSNKVLTSGGAKTALDTKLDVTATAVKATADASGNIITTTYATKMELSAVDTKVVEARSIAEGRARAVAFASYSAFVSALNTASNTDYKVGDNIFIQTQEVPDLWIYSVESTPSSYSYIDDATLVDNLQNVGFIQVGYYKIAAMEIGKVDLRGYVPTSCTVNGKALSSNITLSASDIGALPSDGTATMAISDGRGNDIVSTYATKSEIISYEEM